MEGLLCMPTYTTGYYGADIGDPVGSCVPDTCMRCWGDDRQCVVAYRLSDSTWTMGPDYGAVPLRDSKWERIGCGDRLERGSNTSDAEYRRIPFADEFTGMVDHRGAASCPYSKTPSARPAPCKKPFVD
jgi:hypothetical protein